MILFILYRLKRKIFLIDGKKYYRRASVMKEVLILVEGHTEAAFVSHLLAPYFISQRIIVTPIIVRTSTEKSGFAHKGGINNYIKVKNEMIKDNLPNFLSVSPSVSVSVYDASEKVLPKNVLKIVKAEPTGQKTYSVFILFLNEK